MRSWLGNEVIVWGRVRNWFGDIKFYSLVWVFMLMEDAGSMDDDPAE